MLKRCVSAILLVAAGAGPARGQVKAGGEVLVNTYTPGIQGFPAAAVNAAGDFVVAWESYPGQDGDGSGVFAQRFDRTGAPRGGEFQVNTFTTGDQQRIGRIGIGEDRQGRFVVAWASSQQDGSGWGVFARRFDASGAGVGAEFQVNTYTTGDEGGQGQYNSLALAMNPKGDFVVVWTAYEAGGINIRGQRYDAGGLRLGGEFQVNTVTGVTAEGPDVAMNAGGEFVVAWATYTGAPFNWDIAARRFDASGAPRGAQFQVNTYTTSVQGYGALLAPGVALVDSGAFTIVWNGFRDDEDGFGVFGQAFSAAGAPVGGEFKVNTYTTGSQVFAVARGDASGNMVVTWQSAQDGSSVGVFGQRISPQGIRRGAEFQVNAFTTGFQGVPNVAVDPVGNFAVVWHGASGIGLQNEVALQRYGGLLPTALGVDTSGNGVLEPGESADVRPTWRNVNGAAQTFSATLSGVTGPPGGVPTITDGTGDYGTVANSASAQCTDCYAVSATDPPSRPAIHWDASAVESISPDGQGQQRIWLIHIGRSFTDVPQASPFYRFVETLLHNGVTGGCTATAYCPGAETTREQMAVFVLVAREGPGYAPPACAAPVFGDVSPSSPFCRFIEELARRGVVSGCGGGNYCPAQPVTREQMGVFIAVTFGLTLYGP